LAELSNMQVRRNLKFVVVGLGILAAGCATRPPPPPVVPAAFVARGLSAPYLYSDVIGGTRARAAKLRAAKIRPLAPTAVGVYMNGLDAQLRQQTAGIGVDVLRIGDAILIRIPASLTFDPASSSVKPQFDATLLEIARTVKTRDKTFVDVFAHTDTTGTPQGNQALSDKRAAAVASYLAGHGVAKARIASKGFGESAPLYVPDVTETDRAANRRVEIRLLPYRG
jgi:outer membrane protein OmpA-like peptidoglycan-associated protein